MTIDIGKYDGSKSFVLSWFNNQGGRDISRTISMMASATFVPCIVVAYWLGEETNWHPDTISHIKRLKDFYGYTLIQNKPANSPI